MRKLPYSSGGKTSVEKCYPTIHDPSSVTAVLLLCLLHLRRFSGCRLLPSPAFRSLPQQNAQARRRALACSCTLPVFPWADWGLAGTLDPLRFSSTSGNHLMAVLCWQCGKGFFFSDVFFFMQLLKRLFKSPWQLFGIIIHVKCALFATKFSWNCMWKRSIWSLISLYFRPAIMVGQSLICVWCRRPWSDDEEFAIGNMSWGADGYQAKEIMSAPSPITVNRVCRQAQRN